MRTFHSYGPVEADRHFFVPRRYLVEQLVQQLVGDVKKGGHYFTIWAARQTGKTWFMRQAKTEVTQRYGDQFTVYHFSLERMRNMDYVPRGDDRVLLSRALRGVLKRKLPSRPDLETWENFADIFAKEGGLWDRPLLLLIDEVESGDDGRLYSSDG